MSAPAAPARRINEEELDAIVALARRRGQIPGLTAERLVEEVRHLRRELTRTALLGLELTKEMKRLARALQLLPPGSPPLADFDS